MIAKDSISNIIQTLRPFPIIADRVLKLVREEDVDFQELTELISTDPVLTSLMLRLANSPLYGTINRRIDSLHRAILILGRDHVVEAVMTHIIRGVRESVRLSWPAGDVYFWQHSISVGIVTRLLTNHLHLPYVQQALVVGLLHDIGKLLLLQHKPEAYTNILSQVEKFNTPLHELEQEYFGITHAELGHAACETWNLPTEFAQTISAHHDPPDMVTDSLVNLVKNANLIVKIAGIGNGGNPYVSTQHLTQLPHARLRWSTMQEIIHSIPEIVNELTAMVFGTRQVSHQRVPKPLQQSSKEVAFVSILDRNEQTLLRYILTGMGYTTRGDFKESKSAIKDPGSIDIIVTDCPEQFPRGRQLIINYQEWRMKQEDQPADMLNVFSLRRWLHKQVQLVILNS